MKLQFKCCSIVALIIGCFFFNTYANVVGLTKSANSQVIQRVAVIKADDMREPNDKWKRFMHIVEKTDIKVSIGIIANSFPRYNLSAVKWMKAQQNSGRVEFWNHGWDHNRWKDNFGKKISEFSKSGYKHQKNNLDKAQKKLQLILGKTVTTFGAPFNAMDSLTVKALEDTPELTTIFHCCG